MKLIFKKNDAADIEVSMFLGTAEAPFSYIEMIKSLIAGEPLDHQFHETISDEEKEQIIEVLKEIEKLAEAKKTTEEQVTDGNSAVE